MSLYNSYDRTAFLGELNTPLDTQGRGVFSPATQRSLVIQNIFGTNGAIGLPAGVGLGGAVTQATSKATGVTLNTVSGQITLNAASLASATSVGFTVTDSAVAAADTIAIAIASGGTVASYQVSIDAVAAGSFKVQVRNTSGGALAEALILNFFVLKGQIT